SLRPFFFLWCQTVFQRSQLADLFVDVDEVTTDLLISAELANLSLRLPHGGGSGQRFADGLAFRFVRQTQCGTVAWITSLSAMAGRLSATANNAGDAAGTQVVETGHFRDQLCAALFEVGNGLWHSTLLF